MIYSTYDFKYISRKFYKIDLIKIESYYRHMCYRPKKVQKR